MILFAISGALSAAFALVAESISTVPSVFISIFAASAIEEISKFSVLRKQLHASGNTIPWLPRALIFGTAFAAVEIFLVVSNARPGDGNIPVFSLIGIAAIHIFTSIFYGASATMNSARAALVLLFCFAAHSAYNTVLAFI